MTGISLEEIVASLAAGNRISQLIGLSFILLSVLGICINILVTVAVFRAGLLNRKSNAVFILFKELAQMGVMKMTANAPEVQVVVLSKINNSVGIVPQAE